MKSSATFDLIRKDWRLHRLQLTISMLAGIASLVVLQLGGEVPLVLGSVWFFASIIVLGTMLPISAIVNERKNKSLAFLMSLPVSFQQYTAAKMVSLFGMFLAPWLLLVAAAFLVVEARGVLPHGAIPMISILSMMPVVAFCLITGTALVGESEGWCIAATVVCNSSYGLVWYLLARLPALTAHWRSPHAVWNATEINVLLGEFGLISLFLGLTFFLQSRKRDFV